MVFIREGVLGGGGLVESIASIFPSVSQSVDVAVIFFVDGEGVRYSIQLSREQAAVLALSMITGLIEAGYQVPVNGA